MKIKVYLVNSRRDVPQKHDNPAIYIMPSNDSWNDFGIRSIFDVHFCDNERHCVFAMLTKLIFDVEESSHKFAQKLVSESVLLDLQSAEVEFITQVQSDNGYREIVGTLGHEVSIRVLLAIHDAATTRLHAPTSNWVKLIEHAYFLKSLVRSQSALYAFNKGALFLSNPNFEKISRNDVFDRDYYYEFKLEGFPSPHKIYLDFRDKRPFPGSINLFIGQNGAGKSQAIRSFVEYLFHYNKEILRKKGLVSNFPAFNKVVVISNTTEDPYINNKSKVTKKFEAVADYQYLNIISNKQFSITSGVERITISDAIYKILLDKAISYEKINKLQIMHDSLKKFIDYDKLLIPRKGGVGYVDAYAPNGEELAIDYLNTIDRKREVVLEKNNIRLHLSSGQTVFLKIVAFLLSTIEQNSIILIDEPENFLHPNIEVELVKILNYILDKTNSVAIIATHSSFFAREISSANISVFNRPNHLQKKIVDRPSIQTFANDLDTIANFTFGDLDRVKLFESLLQKAYPDKESLDALTRENRDHLSAEILMYLTNEIMVK